MRRSTSCCAKFTAEAPAAPVVERDGEAPFDEERLKRLLIARRRGKVALCTVVSVKQTVRARRSTTSPLLITNLARPLCTSRTISRATHSPPCNLNIVRCTPGNNFTSSTDASVTQPLSTFRVMTSLADANGMMIWTSSLVTGSKVSFTVLMTSSSATFSGMTSPNISTNSLLMSGWPSFSGRYIIGRESP